VKKRKEGRSIVDAVVVVVAIAYFALSWGFAAALKRL
jgi:hypothetical protein